MNAWYRQTRSAVFWLLCFALAACSGGGSSGGPIPLPSGTPAPTPPPTGKIAHVVIIFQENRTVDNLFHGLPGADTASSGLNSQGQTVPLQPIAITAPYDLDHSHTGFLTEYAGGAMDGFDQVHTTPMMCTACPPPDVRAYGYVPQSEVQPYFAMAEKYTFADRMFQTNEGPSLPAHQYIIAGSSLPAVGSNLLVSENPRDPATGKATGGCDSPPGSTAALIDPSGSENHHMYPCFDHPTLSDLLDARGVSWKYYEAFTGPGLWNAFDAISHVRDGADWSHVVSPNTTIFTDISSGALPAVSWIIPTGAQSDHANSTDGSGPSWVASVVNTIGSSKYWANTAIFITWDDWGGWYDHAKPQILNSYELGFRVPLVIVSPYARPAYVSHVPHEFGSILRYVEENFGLGSLGYTDARSDDFSDCFNYAQTPIVFTTIQSARNADYFRRIPPDDRIPDDDF